MRRVALAVLGLATIALPAAAQARWYKGNTHQHSLNSDGDSPIDVVLRWYREHGYQFTFVTEHEYWTNVEPLNAVLGHPLRFLALPGQEVSQVVADQRHPNGVRQAHVNALGTSRVVMPIPRAQTAGMTVAQSYARNDSLIRAAGGIMQVNHPNFIWSVPLEDMMHLRDSTLFEVWNGHPIVYNEGGVDSLGNVMLSTEARWDSVLSRGRLIFGVADDDSHHFKPQDGENKDQARPGRGWVMVRADTLTREAIVGALHRGDFYATTGITLRDVRITSAEYALEITLANDRRYKTEFIGQGGRVLATSYSLRPSYRITGTERYVRARISDSSGRMAWTQPIRVNGNP